MTAVLAIDPGPVQSAWLLLTNGRVHPANFGIVANEALAADLPAWGIHATTVAIEEVRSYGMAVGREVFDTARWTGRFEQAVWPAPVRLVGRKEVVTALCGSSKAKDANVRAALIDRFGGPSAIRKGGPLQGIVRDLWSALAIAVHVSDLIDGRAA